MPHLDSLGAGNDLGHELVVDTLVDEEPRRTGTYLSLCGDIEMMIMKKKNNRWSTVGQPTVL